MTLTTKTAKQIARLAIGVPRVKSPRQRDYVPLSTRIKELEQRNIELKAEAVRLRVEVADLVYKMTETD